MKMYVHRPTRAVAMQWTGDNLDEIDKFTNGLAWVSTQFNIPTLTLESGPTFFNLDVGDYIVKNDDGTFTAAGKSRFEYSYQEEGKIEEERTY